MANTTTSVEIQVISAQPSGQPREHDSRWIVQCKVIQVLSGSFPKELTTISLLVHSPTKTFSTSVDDLPLYIFTVEFIDPVSDPYNGDLNVLGWRKI